MLPARKRILLLHFSGQVIGTTADHPFFVHQLHNRLADPRRLERGASGERDREQGATQLRDIGRGRTPRGFTWHHHEDPGRMQLVNRRIHARTGHTGGREIWGGGSGHR